MIQPERVLADSQDMNGLWEEWDRATLFLESARIVFAREPEMWQSLGLVDPGGATISSRRDQVEHAVDLDKHLAALADEDILWGAVLVHSYALVQNAAVEELGRKVPGIEDWGAAILERNGKTWTDVKGDLAGAVEVAVVRNAIAHGTRTIDENSAKRIERVGGPKNWRENSRISFGYSQLRGYRNRLKDLLVQSGLG